MEKTFFNVLEQLEAEAREGRLQEGSVAMLRRLVAFVESGRCTCSYAERFIMANFKLGGKELAQLWNKEHPSCRKKADTFRGQLSLAGQYLCRLFGVSPDGLEAAFHGESPESLGYISDILDAAQVGCSSLEGRFEAFGLAGVMDIMAGTASEYEVSECKEEIALLKMLGEVQAVMDSSDMDKLAFIWQVMREPLVTDAYERRQGKRRKEKVPLVNQRKLELFKAFASAGVLVPGVGKVEETVLSQELSPRQARLARCVSPKKS